jgi:hypothetical protein
MDSLGQLDIIRISSSNPTQYNLILDKHLLDSQGFASFVHRFIHCQRSVRLD